MFGTAKTIAREKSRHKAGQHARSSVYFAAVARKVVESEERRVAVVFTRGARADVCPRVRNLNSRSLFISPGHRTRVSSAPSRIISYQSAFTRGKATGHMTDQGKASCDCTCELLQSPAATSRRLAVESRPLRVSRAVRL